MAKQRLPHAGGNEPPNDEAHAFRDAVRDVKPLPHTPLPAGLVRKKTRAPRRPAAAERASLDAVMPLLDPSNCGADAGSSTAATVSGGETSTFQRAGVQNQIMRRLRRGLFPIENELDLHGLTQAVAREQLAHFLHVSRSAGCRCVRVIHGKGYRSGARGPILKVAVDLWLRRHFDVLAFTSARPIDGGTGAVYVLLRA